MSTLANWTYVTPLTIWPVTGYDVYSQPTFGAPYTIMGDWKSGGEVTADMNGTEFVPASTYYFELPDGSALLPERDWYIMRGDVTGTASPVTAGAEKIKKVGGWNMQPFGSDEIPDWQVMT